MEKRHSFEFSGKVLDKRLTLTDPDDSGKRSFPIRPKHITIEQPNGKNNQ